MSIHSLIGSLTSLAREPVDRGALAQLRRSLSGPQATVGAYSYIIPHIDDWRHRDIYFLVGGLFGLHPQHEGALGKGDTEAGDRHAPRLNLGSVFRRLADKGNEEATERRFRALLDCHQDELPHHLRRAISIARSLESTVPIDYVQLYFDILGWSSETSAVQLRWARQYYGHSHPTMRTEDKVNLEEEKK